MKTFICIVIFEYALFLHGSHSIEPSLSGSNKLIVKEILINFQTQYLCNENTFVSYVVSEKHETLFQKDLLDAVLNDQSLTLPTTNYVLTKLSSGTRRRKKPSNIILIENSEALE